MRISDWSSDVCSSDLFVDQIAENLQAQPFLLLLFHLSAIGSDDERQPLVDIRPRDDLTIDNGGGFADIGIALAEQRDIRGDVEIVGWRGVRIGRSEEHTSELQSLMRISYAVFCLNKRICQP